MVKTCCIKNCKSVWSNVGDVTFHSFPKDPVTFTIFMSAIPQNLLGKITKHSFVCSKHFSDDAFQPASFSSFRQRLKTNAIPTLFDSNLDRTTITIEADEVESLTDVDNTDNQMIVDPLPCTAEEDPLAVETVEQKFDVSLSMNKHDIGTQTVQLYLPPPRYTTVNPSKEDVAIQTSQRYLAPSQEVVELRRKLRSLQQRLKRRNTRIQAMATVIRDLKKKRR